MKIDDEAQARYFRESLLNETVSQAWHNTEFYRHHIGGEAPPNIESIEDMTKLPTLTRSGMEEAGLQIIAKNLKLSHFQHTTGTTGKVLNLRRSEEEVLFISKFFSKLQSNESSNKNRPLLLNLAGSYHGTPTVIPGPFNIISATISDPQSISHCINQLISEFEIDGIKKRIQYLNVAMPELLKLVGAAVYRGCRPSDFAIDQISVFGAYVSENVRVSVRDVFGVELVNRFSVSELFGGATWCINCEGFHFDPWVFPEIVKSGTGEQLVGDVGDLLLTGLYPFVQMQPFIRYKTGDLASLNISCGCDRHSYRIHGREINSIQSQKNKEWLICEIDCLEILSKFPLVAVDKASPLRNPLYSIDMDSSFGVPKLRLIVGVSFDVWRHPIDTENLKRDVFERLLECNEKLKLFVNSNRADLSVELIGSENFQEFVRSVSFTKLES